jgi:hypothetical protein
MESNWIAALPQTEMACAFLEELQASKVNLQDGIDDQTALPALPIE